MFQRILSTARTSLSTLQIRNYAARKGTRDKRAKKKVKVVEEKIGFIPHNQRDRERFLLTRAKRKFDDSWKQLPLDNVYPLRYYQWRVHPFEEAVQILRKFNHPEILNQPDNKVKLQIELNMQGEKKNKFVENFTRIAPIPHHFDHGEQRALIVFTKNETAAEQCRNAGAQMVGGVDLIKNIQNGAITLTDFDFILSDPAILPDLVVLKGVMKRKFPNIKAGTLDVNLVPLVDRFLNGLSYTGTKDEFEKDFGLVDAPIGTINMDPKQLEENAISLIHNVCEVRPKNLNSFIRRCLVTAPGIHLKFPINHKLYLPDSHKEAVVEEDKQERVAASA